MVGIIILKSIGDKRRSIIMKRKMRSDRDPSVAMMDMTTKGQMGSLLFITLTRIMVTTNRGYDHDDTGEGDHHGDVQHVY